MSSPTIQAGILAPLFFIILAIFFWNYMPNPGAVQAGGKILKNISKKFSKSKNKKG